jgi:hypothetical protein
MLKAFALYVARDRAKKYGKEYLSNTEGVLEIIAEACKQIDIVFEKQIWEPSEYIRVLQNELSFYEIYLEVMNLGENLGTYVYDTDLTYEEKRKIIMNSLVCFDFFYQDFIKNYNYEKFKNEENELKHLDKVYESLLTKLEETKEVEKLCQSIEKIKMNFIITYDTLNIYPIIVDLLTDILMIEYESNVDKKLNQSIIEKWADTQNSQEERDTLRHYHFTKLEFLELVKFNRLRTYLLAEYARTLQVDKKELRKFMQNILYYDTKNHKNTPSLDFDIIDKIPRRPFLLEKTKMVIGGL